MTTLFAALALVLGLTRLVIFVALHLVSSPYNPIEHAVSDYAVGPTRRLSSIMTWTTAGMWAALAAAVITGFPPSSDHTVIICLVALAVIFVALPFLPTDLEGERTTGVGRVHLLAAIVWFALSYACMGNVIRLLQPIVPPALHALLVVTSWVALIGLIALVVALVFRPLRRIAFGISERVFLVAVNVFYLTAAIGILIMER